MTILYQDARIVVCLKPVGVLSTDEPDGMPARLRQALGTDCIRTVHRLDAAVGGVMVFARSRAAAAILSQQIREHSFKKEYLAAVHGCLDAESGTLRDYLGYDRAARMAFSAPAPSKEAKEAVLDYRLLERCDASSLLHICLHTGRTHQIRAQLALRGHPLLGDRKYGGADTDDASAPALWSYRVSFTHPQSGERLTFSAPPPAALPWLQFSCIARIEREE